ncbi:MAG: Dihydrolipoyllysine-residue acetyltransferase component of pyruvate dehydrogenase complex [Candidatus Heimdallarchaeota archaeon LC_3]|nr:MAG: Dihydrolipoyllysine-residue acetyltransferase component of pyruvate dehydrogenase complex [Candidatus Heimdallarchaeota archaeon LC_3]
MFEFKFADIGEGITEGELLEWHVKPGDSIEKDGLVVEVMTEKVNIEIAAPVAGIIKETRYKVGDIIKVGEVMFTIEESGTAPVKGKKTPKIKEKPKEKDDSLFVASDKVTRRRKSDVELNKPQTPTKVAVDQVFQQEIVSERPLTSPGIRREAREKNIDLRHVKGSGSGGRITREDFEYHLQQGPVGQPSAGFIPVIPRQLQVPRGSEKRIPIKGIRRAISKSMARSKQTAAHFSYFDEFDMASLDKLRKDARAYAEKQGIPIKVTYLPFIIKAVTRSLIEHPTLNASMDDEKEELILKGFYNIGIAVDTPNGLMVPVIKDADQKSIWQLSTEIKDLADRARIGKLKLDEITGGTFTLTNVGPIGGLMSTPIINHPEVGIIGIHKGKLRPVVVEDSGKPEIVIRRMMYLSISVDHRVTDGANAARFMNQVIGYLENPASMFLDIM